ncbi:NADH-quinone oxidoreductase subunit 5 family protein [Fodinicola feengrottensis]|uniref:NADH-quinone oxidoreductase subunit 5 family protein n=1 Tax=Fodinicola feengrottensis TaxID=435914 RepID=UPI00244176A4|nr:proton-conducting transporter membrane subunit [Fodinicola feengrottensis]
MKADDLIAALAAFAVLAPLIAAAVGLLHGSQVPGGPGAIAVTGTLAATAASVFLLVMISSLPQAVDYAVPLTPTGGIAITAGVRVDTLSASVAVMVSAVALAIQVFSLRYVRVRHSSYAAMVSLFTAAMLLVVLGSDLMVLYVGWEIMGLCSYLLIGHQWEERKNTTAAIKAFLMTRVGDVGFLFGIFTLGFAAGSFRISTVLAAVPRLPAGLVLLAAVLLTLGVVAKAGQFPLHGWLPDAMAGPAPVSALIHAATMVAAGSYVVARLYPVFLAAPAALTVLAVLAGISAVGAALAALAAEDLKRLLAYSTISQVGLMLAALAVGGRLAAIAHLISHGAFKALLFLATGTVIVAVGSTLLARMGGLRRTMPPLTCVCMTIGWAALAAVPPTAGFFSKDAILAAAAQPSSVVSPATAVFVVGCTMLTTVVTAAYATRAWLLIFFGERTKTVMGDPGPSMAAPLVGLAGTALLLGLAVRYVPELLPDPFVAAESAVLVTAGIIAAYVPWRLRSAGDPAALLGAARPLLASAFGTDTMYERTGPFASSHAAFPYGCPL